MSIELGGFLGIAALLIGLFAWLQQDITRLGDRLAAVEHGQAEVRERLERLAGLLEGLREAVIGRSLA
jgi:hypothetical protein